VIRKILVGVAAVTACAALTCCSVPEGLADVLDASYDLEKAGTCFIKGYNTLDPVRCGKDHNAEVVGTYEAEPGPRSQAVEEAKETCAAMVAEYVGPNWEMFEPQLHSAHWTSAAENWDTKRTIHCYVAADGKFLDSSLKDAAP